MQAGAGLVFLILAIGIGLLGVLLLVRGRWPRRAGADPHCSKCNYLLVGLEGGNCPECGQIISEKNIRFGERKTRPVLIGSGLVLLVAAVGAGVVAQVSKGRPLTAYLPTWYLICNLNSPASASAAWAELDRRMALGGVSESSQESLDRVALGLMSSSSPVANAMLEHLNWRCENGKLGKSERDRFFSQLLIHLRSTTVTPAYRAWWSLQRQWNARQLPADVEQKIIALALGQQAAPKPLPVTPPLMDFLGNLAVRGKLSKEESDQFFSQACAYTVEVRPIVQAGDQVQFRIKNKGRAPDSIYWKPYPSPPPTLTALSPSSQLFFTHWEEKELRVNGKVVSQGTMSGSGVGIGDGNSTSSTVLRNPGGYHLEVTVRVQIYAGPIVELKPGMVPRWEHTFKLSAHVEVVRELPPEAVRAINDPAQADVLRRSIRISEVRSPVTGGKGVELMVRIDHPPVDVAFDVIAKEGGREWRVGTITQHAGEDGGFGISDQECPALRTFDVVLRGSQVVARQSIGFDHYWAGMIEFKDITATAK